MSIQARKPHDLTVSEALVAEAEALGLDVAKHGLPLAKYRTF
jgi:antitoxin CcdA